MNNAILALERAIVADPNFAMAYRAIGSAHSSLGNIEKRREYTQKALELSEYVSVREKYLIQANYYLASSEKTLYKAIEAYEKLLQIYPEDPIGNGNLPNLYIRIGKNDKAIELSEKASQLFPSSVLIYCNFAYHYFTQGLYKKAEDILKYYEKNISENSSPIKLFLAFSLLFQNKYDLALTEIERSISLAPTNPYSTVTKGDIHLFMGDFLQAEREFSQLLKNKASEQIGRGRLGSLYLLLGNIEDSNVQIEKGLELQKIQGRNSRAPDFYLQSAYRSLRAGEHEKALEFCNGALDYAVDMEKQGWQCWALYFKGLTYIGKKSIDEAKRTAEELKDIADDSFNEKHISWYYHLMGQIEMENKDFTLAAEYFVKAIELLNFEGHWIDDHHALFIEPLAKAYFQSGDLGKTRQEYEKILSLTNGRLCCGDIYARSVYMLGKICQQQGGIRRAVEYYENFLDLLKDADPGYPDILDVKKRLAEIKSQ